MTPGLSKGIQFTYDHTLFYVCKSPNQTSRVHKALSLVVVDVHFNLFMWEYMGQHTHYHPEGKV